MSIFLETARLIIKSPSMEDRDSAYVLHSDPEVMNYIEPVVSSKEELNTWLGIAVQHQEKHGFSMGSVFEKKSGTYIGRAGLYHFAFDDTRPEIVFSFILHKKFWHKGYATEIAKALISWGFRNLTVEKLTALVNPKNEKSRHVLEKVGMSYIKLDLYHDTEVAYYEIYKLPFDSGKIELVPASLKDYPVIQNMGRFYVYDMSEYLGSEQGWEIPEDGLYECIDFKKYWETADAFPFLIRYSDELAGFVIIDKKGSGPQIDFNMAQFFILRKFKGKGMGRYVAQKCFNQFRGSWEVMVIPGNEGAYRFWRSIISDYTNRDFVEYTKTVAHLNNSTKNIFKFNSKA